jgi:DNA-binding transcriptional ArsR family regulator
VAVRRDGRNAYYRLHDHHVGELLGALRCHHEHVSPHAAEATERAEVGADHA